MKHLDIIESLILSLPLVIDHHAHSTKLYTLLKQVSRKEIEGLFADKEPQYVRFKPFGELVFPYQSMGAVDSLNLFDLDELIIFSFYWVNRKRYRYVLDLGSNIGLHSIILSKCGFEVRAYEPDPQHFKIMRRNFELNHCLNVQPFNMAVSGESGEMEFVRVLGNTTGSHLAGAKMAPYGDLDRFTVEVEGIASLITWADLIKMDIEGQEKEVILTTDRVHWLNTDALVEIENEDNAAAIYNHFKMLGVNLFSQKINWQQVRGIKDMPTSYREGTLFVTCKSNMPW